MDLSYVLKVIYFACPLPALILSTAHTLSGMLSLIFELRDFEIFLLIKHKKMESEMLQKIFSFPLQCWGVNL